MSALDRALHGYLRTVGGGDWPFLVQERNYLASQLGREWAVADVGGGEGTLANWVAARTSRVVIVDRETTSLPRADREQYAGALTRAMQGRSSRVIVAVRADATALPFAPASLDGVMSSQMLEHLPVADRESFFGECARVLKPHGILTVSTPNGPHIAGRRFWVSAIARKAIPAGWVRRLPRLLRGPWLEHGVEEWERRVGHYDHGCSISHLREASAAEGFEEVDRRFLHTRWTAFWFELVCTCPLVVLLALPLVRLLYAIESVAPATDGINLMMTFRKRA